MELVHQLFGLYTSGVYSGLDCKCVCVCVFRVNGKEKCDDSNIVRERSCT